MSTQVLSPFPLFTDRIGKPLNAGYVYIGVSEQDPETNPQQAYWDEALTIPAAQPLRTDGGYVVNGGNPATVYTSAAFSIRVRDKNGVQVFYRASVPSADALLDELAGDGGAAQLGYLAPWTGAVKITQAQKNQQWIHISEFGVVPDPARTMNQQANIQKALDYAASLAPFGCTILFDAVNYRWDSSIVVKNHGTKLLFRNAQIYYHGTGPAIDFDFVGGNMPVECEISEVNIRLDNAISPAVGVRWRTSYSQARKINVVIPAAMASATGILLENLGDGVGNGPYHNVFDSCNVDSKSAATNHFGIRMTMNAPYFLGCNANLFMNCRMGSCLVGYQVHGTGNVFAKCVNETPPGTGTAYKFIASIEGQCNGNTIVGGYIEGATAAFDFAALAKTNIILAPYGTGIGTWVIDASAGKTNLIISSNIPSEFAGGAKFRGASSDPNVLDYYEEGNFTPAMTFATPGNLSTNYGANNRGRYTRIGDNVTVHFDLDVTPTFTTAAGAFSITGLPFTSGAVPGNGVIGSMPALTFSGGRSSASIQSNPNLATVGLVFHGPAVVSAAATAAAFTSGAAVRLQASLVYKV